MARRARRRSRISLETARWRLGTLWFVGSGLIFLLLAVQSLMGVYEDRVEAVWGWALPNFLPTLMMMMGVFAAAALVHEADSDRMKVRSNFLRLAIALSGFHLFCVLLTLLLRPLVPGLSNDDSIEPMAIFETSNLFLGPLQGLVGGAIGALFFSKAEETPGNREER
jgi:hypothetical protein